MACKIKENSMFIFVVLFFVLKQYSVLGVPQVPCYFVFGDSLYDNGNNNFLLTNAKVNFPPYGIDFPDGPTGRFSNGRNMADVIAELLGFDNYIPPFATARGAEIMKGVNYASGAAGILNESGRNQGDRVTMDEQLSNHRLTILRIIAMLGSRNAAMELLHKCIYTVDMGNNDYLNNYFLPQYYGASKEYTPDQFAELLVQKYSQQLRRLYYDGARKVAVVGVGLLGCVPRILATYDRNGSACVDSVNYAAQLFNDKLVSLVRDLNINLTGAKFTYINSFGIGSGDPTPLGFRFLNTSCCKVASGEDTCIPFQTPCANRSEYVFWDAVHPTEAITVLMSGRSYKALLPTDASPYDISQLAQL